MLEGWHSHFDSVAFKVTAPTMHSACRKERMLHYFAADGASYKHLRACKANVWLKMKKFWGMKNIFTMQRSHVQVFREREMHTYVYRLFF